MALFASVKLKLGLKLSFTLALMMLILVSLVSYFLITKQGALLEEQLMDKAVMQAGIGAKAMEFVLEKAVDNGVFTLEEVFDTNYVEIPGFDPPKYHSKIDFYLDNTILGIEDKFLDDPVVIYATMVDINGYVPTHNTRFQQPITGDKEEDLIGNRTKRFFNDPVGIKAARHQQKFLKQVYYRDTGEMLWDIAVPVFVKGRHWGAFRMAYSMEKIEQNIRDLTYSIGVVMLLLTILLGVTTFILVNRSIVELGRITRLASRMADGDLDVQIESRSTDEIGQLADVLERMRVSLQKTLERLKRNF